MSDLTAWLGKLWEASESTALLALNDTRFYNWTVIGDHLINTGTTVIDVAGFPSLAQVIAQNDLAATLNRVRAERTLLTRLHTAWFDEETRGQLRTDDEPPPVQYCRACTYDLQHGKKRPKPDGVIPWPCQVWKWIAYGWSHCDGYDREWLPLEVRR